MHIGILTNGRFSVRKSTGDVEYIVIEAKDIDVYVNDAFLLECNVELEIVVDGRVQVEQI